MRDGRVPAAPEATAAAVAVAAVHDADVFRGVVEWTACLARPDEVLARPGFMDKVRAAGAGASPITLPGPDRATLVGYRQACLALAGAAAIAAVARVVPDLSAFSENDSPYITFGWLAIAYVLPSLKVPVAMNLCPEPLQTQVETFILLPSRQRAVDEFDEEPAPGAAP